VRGQRHAPSAVYPRERRGIFLQKAGWVPGPVWRSAENVAFTGIFFEIFFVLSIIYVGTYIPSASSFGSACPLPCHLALTLAQPHSSGLERSSPPNRVPADNGLLLPLFLAYREGTGESIDSFLPAAYDWTAGRTSILRGARIQYSPAVIVVFAAAFGT